MTSFIYPSLQPVPTGWLKQVIAFTEDKMDELKLMAKEEDDNNDESFKDFDGEKEEPEPEEPEPDGDGEEENEWEEE